MKFTLADGTAAHLNAIVQARDYQRPYLEQPPDSLDEIKRLATINMPPWRDAPLLVIGVEGKPLEELLRKGRLPSVMCIGEFVSYRFEGEELRKAVFLHVVWLQDDMTPHMSAENEAAFKTIEWDRYLPE